MITDAINFIQVGEMYRCHEDVCRWGYQYCDEVIRRCSECHDKLQVCFKPELEPNCTLLCLDTFYPGHGAAGLICEAARNIEIWQTVAIVLIIVTTLCVGLLLYFFRKYIIRIFRLIFTQRNNQSLSSDDETQSLHRETTMNQGLLSDYKTVQELMKDTSPVDAKDRVRCELSLNVASLETTFVTLTPISTPEGEKVRFVFNPSTFGK